VAKDGYSVAPVEDNIYKVRASLPHLRPYPAPVHGSVHGQRSECDVVWCVCVCVDAVLTVHARTHAHNSGT
jgi:hypothetical protein